MPIPTSGPSLDFTRTYELQLAAQQTRSETPGPLGYGSTDNGVSSLTVSRPVAGDVCALDGARSAGLPARAPLKPADEITQFGGETCIADSAANRIQEIPGTLKTAHGHHHGRRAAAD